jgi:hypothetical protein
MFTLQIVQLKTTSSYVEYELDSIALHLCFDATGTQTLFSFAYVVDSHCEVAVAINTVACSLLI